MDEVERFFNITQTFESTEQPATSSKVTLKRTSTEQNSKLLPKYPKTCADSKEVNNKDPEVEKFILDDELFDGDTPGTVTDDDVYSRYIFNLNRNTDLPVNDFKDEIIRTIRTHPVVILEGDTGCGKTTQVPQYILDDAYTRREYCKIVCTQPRRIAAMSIAKRVSSERKWEEGSVVGYQVGLHANMSDDTRLLYCTTGVLLQKLIKEKNLFPFTHVILDEVHERDQEMDFLLIIVRRLLVTTSKKVKVILMSATMDTSEFSKYFTICKNPAPVIRANTRRLYQVKEFYLCGLNRINTQKIEVKADNPFICPEMYNLALKLVLVIDNIEKQELDCNLEEILNPNRISILIFLPGINEINEMCKKLEELSQSNGSQIKLYPIRLHSVISPEEQSKIFQRPPLGYRKVILATNIAESSITVPDVKYVIDFCLTKTLVTDTATNFNALQLNWASRANCRQRAGRAGRLMNGRVYRLIPRYFYENVLEEFTIPEMLRCPLENVVLKAKLLDMGSPSTVLAMSMNPPNLTDIQNTILLLKEIGALYKYVKDKYTKDDGDISFMGRVMAVMPLDVRLTRLILLGYAFNVLQEAIIIAAGLSVRSIFKAQYNKSQNGMAAFIQKLKWADGSSSDLIAILRVYKEWSSLHKTTSTESDEYSWAQRNFIDLRLIKEMHLLVLELKERLMHFNIKDQPTFPRLQSLGWDKSIILKIVIAGAFYPNYFVRSKVTEPEKERAAYHDLCGNDPCSTVYFTNFDPSQIGSLYAHSIKELFAQVGINPNCINIHFQSNSERVYVIFKDNNDSSNNDNNYAEGNVLVPGDVRLDVYKALRMRLSNRRNIINVMSVSESIKYAESHGLGTMCGGVWKPTKPFVKNVELLVLPSLYQRYISGYITHIETCSNFYFQPISEVDRLREIHEMINDSVEVEDSQFSSYRNIENGMMLTARFEGKFHRAQIIKTITVSRQHKKYKVYFIDFGNVSTVNFEDLRYYSSRCQSLKDIPPRVFKCRLALVEASCVISPTEQWVDEAMEYLQEHADSGKIVIEVYSVTAGVSNVILKKDNSTINEILVEKGLARSSDESYLSKMDHDLRLRKQSAENRLLADDNTKQHEEYLLTFQSEMNVDVEPPPKGLCKKVINLRGPYSSLEVGIFSAVKVGNWKTVHTERDSINFMLLDTNPKDAYERLMVAAGISESPNAENLTIRDTTLMPNIHGFAAMMTLLFAPCTQIKTNDTHTKYMAILSGLGYDESTMEAIYNEHDISLNLDFELLLDDLELINQIRYAMDALLFTEPQEERSKLQAKEVSDLMVKIQKLLMRLLSKNRKYIEIDSWYNDGEWRHYSSDEIIEPININGKRTLFPQLSYRRLYNEKFEHIHNLTKQCAEMHNFSRFDSSIRPLQCRLCNQQIENVVQLRLHLLSQQHRDREQQIRFRPPVV